MKKYVAVVGMVLGILLVIAGFSTEVPERKLGYYYGGSRVTEYVGGDAYNYIIEASVRGGEIAGAKTSKAVYITGGSILAVISAFAFVSVKSNREITTEKAMMENTFEDVAVGEN